MNIKMKVNSMKARFLMTMAVAAMTLAACNNEETDTWREKSASPADWKCNK